MVQLQAGAANAQGLLFQTFGPPQLGGQDRPCSLHMASAADPYGLNIMTASRAFQQLFFAREDIQHAFLHKRTAHMILAALCVAACVSLLTDLRTDAMD